MAERDGETKRMERRRGEEERRGRAFYVNAFDGSRILFFLTEVLFSVTLIPK